MDNPKVVVGTGKFGKCLMAGAEIRKGEILAEFDGEIYEAPSIHELPNDDIEDHAIQFAEHKWRESNSLARYINHSCEPNCGVQDLFKIVAMRDIQKGEELVWDYDMTEDDEWRMECHCGTPSCRKIIGAYRNLPKQIREKYKGYISEWLLDKYK